MMMHTGLKSLCRLLIFLCLILAVFPKVQGAGRCLSLSDVSEAAIRHNAESKNLETKLELTEVQLIRTKADFMALSAAGKVKNLQALLKEAVKLEEKRSKNSMPSEISLSREISSLADELKDIGQELGFSRLLAAFEAEQAYYDVLLEIKRLSFWENREEEALLQLNALRGQCLIGAALKSDADIAETEYARAQTEKAKAILALESKKGILGQLVGQDVNIGYTFCEDIPGYKLTRENLEPALLAASEQDFSLYQARQAEKRAEADYTAVLGSRPSIYLLYETEIEQYILSCKGAKLDYAAFLQNYHKPGLDGAHMWEGKYLFSWLCFQAEGPREWIDLSGMSKEIAKDQKAVIFSLYLAKNSAKENARKAVTVLAAKINSAYEKAASIEKRRQEASAKLSHLAKTLESLEVNEKLTGRGSSAIYQVKLQSEELKEELAENRLLYAKAVSTFNLASGGYLYQPQPDQQAVLPAKEQSDAWWQLKTSDVQRRFSLTVKLTPVVYDVDSFQLFYNDEPVGAAALDRPIETANLSYQPGQDTLLLKFYKQGVLRYTASISANSYEGVLAMQPNSRALSEYEAVKQKKTALEAEIRKLKKEYLKAVEAGDNVSAISLKDKLDAATDEMLQAEAKMLELRNPKTP